MAWMKHHFPQVQSVIRTCFTPQRLKIMENSTSLKLISVVHRCFRPRELNGMDETQLASSSKVSFFFLNLRLELRAFFWRHLNGLTKRKKMNIQNAFQIHSSPSACGIQHEITTNWKSDIHLFPDGDGYYAVTLANSTYWFLGYRPVMSILYLPNWKSSQIRVQKEYMLKPSKWERWVKPCVTIQCYESLLKDAKYLILSYQGGTSSFILKKGDVQEIKDVPLDLSEWEAKLPSNCQLIPSQAPTEVLVQEGKA